MTDLAKTERAALALDAARDIARFCRDRAALLDSAGAHPDRELALMGASGLLAAPLAYDLGGAGLGCEPGGMSPLLRLLAALGAGNLSVARLYEGHVNALLLIQQFGSRAQAQAAARAVLADRAVFAVWNTEGASGLRIEPAGARWRLSGAKTFASGVGLVDWAVVTAEVPGEDRRMLLLDLGAVSASINQSGWRPMGMKASASGVIDFTGTEIERDAFLGKQGDYYRQPWFGAGAIRFAAAQLGAAAELVDLTRAELRASGRDGAPAQRTRIATMMIAIETGRLWIERAAGLANCSSFGGAVEPPVGDAAMVAFADMTRTVIERICLDAIELAQRSVGARALIAPHPIEWISHDLMMYLRQAGPDAAVANIGEFASINKQPVLGLWEWS